MNPTRSLLEAEAARQGTTVTTELVLVEGAIAALFAGDGETHDRLVSRAALEVAGRSDVVVLAQASMARALAVMPEEQRPAPILSSPHLALATDQGAVGSRAALKSCYRDRSASADWHSIHQPLDSGHGLRGMPWLHRRNAPSKKRAFGLPWPGWASIHPDPDPPRQLHLDHRGRPRDSCYGEPDSPVYLVLTPKGKWAVGYGIDLPRTADEELAGLGYEPVALPSFGKTLPEAVTELAVGRVAADGAFPGAAGHQRGDRQAV